MRVRVQNQEAQASVGRDDDGVPVLLLRPHLISPSAFCALVLALEPLAEQGYQYLQSAS